MHSADNQEKKISAGSKYAYANKPIKVANPYDYSVLMIGGSSDNLSVSRSAFLSTGCSCEFATNTADAIKILLKKPVDLVILSSGFTLALRKIREFSSVTILSILSRNALEIGGCELTLRSDNDNYDKNACEKILFILQEYRNAFRFSGATRCSNVYVNMDTFEAYINDKKVPLKPMEMRILFYLIKHKNQVIKRNVFVKAVWNQNEDMNSRTVDVHLMDLRKTLAKHEAGLSISTLRNVGIRLLEDTISL